MLTYTDARINSSGSLDAWTVTYDLDDSSTDGYVSACETVTLPNGKKMPEVSAGSWGPMTVASVSYAMSDYTDKGQGQIYGAHEIDFNCGADFVGVTLPRISIKNASYILQTVNANNTATYKLACPGGTKATCGTQYLVGNAAANYAQQIQLYVIPQGAAPYCSDLSLIHFSNNLLPPCN